MRAAPERVRGSTCRWWRGGFRLCAERDSVKPREARARARHPLCHLMIAAGSALSRSCNFWMNAHTVFGLLIVRGVRCTPGPLARLTRREPSPQCRDAAALLDTRS